MIILFAYYPPGCSPLQCGAFVSDEVVSAALSTSLLSLARTAMTKSKSDGPVRQSVPMLI